MVDWGGRQEEEEDAYLIEFSRFVSFVLTSAEINKKKETGK